MIAEDCPLLSPYFWNHTRCMVNGRDKRGGGLRYREQQWLMKAVALRASFASTTKSPRPLPARRLNT